MGYEDFTTDDFATDTYFCRWVLKPDIQTDAFWMEWLSTNANRSREIQQARRIVLVAAMEPGNDPTEQTIDELWQGIEQRTQSKPKIIAFTGWRMAGLAAASILLLLSAFIGYRYVFEAAKTYETANGEIRRLQLPDGTMVTLNANSSLRMPSSWSHGGAREAWLTGEAFFKVKKQQADGHPVKFTVHTDDVDVEVKGTEFNVNTRQDKTRVILSEGDIQLRLVNSKKEMLQMKPGDLVDFSKAKQALAIRKVTDTRSWYSWKDNRWTFESTPLSEVATLITETYGFPVRLEGDSTGNQKVTGIIPSDNLEDILASLESILDVTTEQKDKQIRIQPN
ncbi:FecR family protein [Dyadobacter psychrotolerans]|uniref:DUF4974 domain-containing protein n=1 Tax=Dyadobacter psychrotolerans TaxID=2541721 RepID=A0A4R5DI06_9BACT|nr:FecR domain-containing protein [Dyadobacter psychrotolerans]TDE12917.1 DUF4974 domain-containing protein [Dyadobacter psychrotolerans]